MTNRGSFDNCSSWMEQITKNASDKCKRILCANKCDCPEENWKVTSEEGKEAADKNDEIPFFEVSAKEGTNVDEMFHKMAELVLVHLEEDAERKGSEAKKRGGKNKFALGGKSGTSNKGCC